MRLIIVWRPLLLIARRSPVVEKLNNLSHGEKFHRPPTVPLSDDGKLSSIYIGAPCRDACERHPVNWEVLNARIEQLNEIVWAEEHRQSERLRQAQEQEENRRRIERQREVRSAGRGTRARVLCGRRRRGSAGARVATRASLPVPTTHAHRLPASPPPRHQRDAIKARVQARQEQAVSASIAAVSLLRSFGPQQQKVPSLLPTGLHPPV